MQEKEQNISPIKQRILSFASTLGISKREFYSKIGVSRGTLESRTGITEDVIAKFFATYPEVSIEWLMFGTGEMLKQKYTTDINDSTVTPESENTNSEILPQIKQIAINEGITIRALERVIGASNGVLSRAIANGTDIQSKWLKVIIENYPQYSAQWLLTGKGEMLNHTTQPATMTATATKLISTDSQPEETIEPFTEAVKKAPGAIPLVSEKAVGGFYNEHFSIKERDVLAYYVIPKFRHLSVDFMIEVIGDSMIPKLYPGDIIACSIINQSQFIQWNKPHLIATREQGLIVKRIRKSDVKNCFLAISDNHDYDPFDIPIDEIVGMARIVGVIHLE